MLGKFEESLKEYDAAIKLDPSNPRYHSNKGDALDKLGKSIAAIKEHDLTIQLGKEQGRVEEPLTAPGNDERCMLCNTKLEEIGAEIRGIRFEKPSGGTAVFCANCYACSVCGTKRSKIHHILLDVSDLMLCETHLNALESYDGKSWEEFPDEFLNAMTNRLTYIRSIWETRANEILKSGSKPSKPSMWSAVGQLVNVLANNYDAANWWQLGDMKGDLDKNARMKNEYQYHRDFLASLDARIARVKEVIKDRKQLKVLQQLHPNSSERSSNDPIAVLKLRFAKGEIDKSEYEEKLKILLES